MRFLMFCFLAACGVLYAQEHVRNTDKSAGYTLTLTEEVRFGSEDGDDNYIWPSGNTKILPGPDGTMYIVDPDGNRVLTFDRDGKFLRRATGAGNGPGELQTIMCVSQDKAGKIYLVDVPPNSMQGQSTLKIFNPDMSFDRQLLSHDLGYQPAVVQISPDGKLLGGLYYKMDDDMRGLTLKIGVLDIEAKKMVNLFYDFKMPMPDFQRLQDKDMWTDFVAKQFKMLYSFPMFAFDSSGFAYSAMSDKYAISQWKPGAEKPLRIIERTYKPRPFGDKERSDLLDRFQENIPAAFASILTKQVMEQALEKADLPRIKQPMVNMLAMEDSGVMVVHDLNAKTRENTLDLFDTKGRFLCQVDLPDFAVFAYSAGNPYPRMVFRDGYAYTILTDEDMENSAVRYKYELKAGK